MMKWNEIQTNRRTFMYPQYETYINVINIYMNFHFIVSSKHEWCEWWLVHNTTFFIINIQPFPFTFQTFHCPWEIIPQVIVDFFYKIWWFFLHLWTLMHISVKITLCKHVWIKTWLNINQCKIMMIHTCHMQILFFYTHYFSTQTC